MKKLKLASVSIVSLLLAACAATPKPQLAEEHQTKLVQSFAAVRKCSDVGMLSPDLAASGLTYIRWELENYTYDQTRFNADVEKNIRVWRDPSAAQCNRIAVGISERKQQIMRNHAASDEVIENNNAILNSTKSQQTYCNKIGTQVFCNSF